MVTAAPKSDSFPSTTLLRERAASRDASFVVGRIRLEWNGLTGWRELRSVARSDADDDSRAAISDEQLIGEVSEPFS